MGPSPGARDECGTIGHVELPQQARDVEFHGVLGDAQFARDIPIAGTRRDQLQDLPFAGRELPVKINLGGLGGLIERNSDGQVRAPARGRVHLAVALQCRDAFDHGREFGIRRGTLTFPVIAQFDQQVFTVAAPFHAQARGLRFVNQGQRKGAHEPAGRVSNLTGQCPTVFGRRDEVEIKITQGAKGVCCWFG